MSVQAIVWVLEHSPTEGTDRLVLLALANHAGEHPVSGAWECWPGVRTIAREARLRRTRTVQDSLKRLVASGHIERIINGAPDFRIPAHRRPNLYRIVLHTGVTRHDTPSTEWGDARRPNGVTRDDQMGCRDASPKPSLNRQGTPSGIYTARADVPGARVDKVSKQLIENAVTDAARRYAKDRGQAETIHNPAGLARWWIQERGDEARQRAAILLRDYDLTGSQLVDAIRNPNARWLAGHRREDGPSERQEDA